MTVTTLLGVFLVSLAICELRDLHSRARRRLGGRR